MLTWPQDTKRFIAKLLFIAFAACTPNLSAPALGPEPQTIEVWLDPTLPANQAADTLDALDAWNTALNGYARFHVSSAPVDVVVRPLYTSGNLLGLTQGNLVSLFPNAGPMTALHELGHVLGLPDANTLNTLMATPITASVPCVDGPTLDAIAARFGWSRTYLRESCL